MGEEVQQPVMNCGTRGDMAVLFGGMRRRK